MLPHKLFLPLEEALKEKISTGEAPFLGLFADEFPSARRKFICKAIQRSSFPIDEYIEGLQKFPALLSTYLVIHIVEGFGISGHFEVYPLISEPLGMKTISDAQKQKLWRAFRRSCVRLGLSISHRTAGVHYMVEEYLRQAGFPINFIDRLTLKMISYTDDVGIPDEDDPDSIRLWRQGLLERLNAPFPKVAKEAMERDEKGYYAQLFIQLLKGHEPKTRIESLIQKTIKEGPQTRPIKKIAIPQIVFKDSEMGILLPGGIENKWQVDLDGDLRRYNASYVDDRFVPFESQLPLHVRVTEVQSGVEWKHPLWENDKTNRLMVFAMPSGRLSNSASMSDKQLYFDPGDYLIILRFEPGNDEIDVAQICEDPSLYMAPVALTPGKSLLIQRGPAKLYLKANDTPALNWLGDPVRGVRGNEFYPSRDLKLKVTIPDEFLEFHDHHFTLTCKSRVLGDDVEIPVTGSGEIIDLYPCLSGWKPGVGKMLAIVRRKDSQRPLVRNSITLWHGLKFVKRRIAFVCDQLPENRFEDGCQNLKICEAENTITYADDTARFFKMAFQDERRIIYFTWAVPGIFLGLESYHAGNVYEKPIKAGTTLAVSPTVRKVLKIYATTPAILTMGVFETKSNFGRIGSKRIPLASLIEYVSPENNALYFRDEKTSIATPLVYLVSPHEVTYFSVKPAKSFHKITFQFVDRPEAVRISARNLLDGTKSHTKLASGESSQYDIFDFTSGGKAHVFRNSDNEYHIDISLDNWQPGLWLLEFEAKLHGGWGALTNENNEIYADGLVISEVGKTGSFRAVLRNYLDYGDDPNAFCALFERIQKALLYPYARESWNEMYWIEKVWKEMCCMVNRYGEHGLQLQLTMLYFSTMRPPEIASEAWIPSQHIGANLPQLYCLPKHVYQKVKKQDNILISCIRSFPRLNQLLDIYLNNHFDMASLMGFSNAFTVHSQGEFPKKFNMAQYQAALISRDLSDRWRLLNDDQWHPASGDYLGPMHYRYALMMLKASYRDSLATNSYRRGRLLNLVRAMNSAKIDKFVDDARLIRFTKQIDLGLFEDDDQLPASDEIEQEKEHLRNIIRFVSLFAQVCRCETRRKGVMNCFFSDIKQRIQAFDAAALKATLCYMLYICEDIFAFYLLLWELIFTADYDAGR